MILDKLFPHLRRGVSGDFLASKVLNWYGRTFIGGPKLEDVPGQDLSVRQRIVDTYFKIPVDRMPPKREEYWEISQLWTAQLRDEEEKQVAKAVVIGTALLCSALIAVGVFIQGVVGEEGWWTKHKAKVAAQEAIEYRAERPALLKKWAIEFADYSPKKCISEVADLREKDTPEQMDRYTALQTACQAKSEDIKTYVQPWSYDKCLDYGKTVYEQTTKEGSKARITWLDNLVIGEVCITTHGEKLNQELITYRNELMK